jgi:hypothetical protein
VKTKIYIAGPMTGLPEFNFPAFFKAEEFLKEQNYEPLNPANLKSYEGDLTGDELWAWYMRGAIELLIQAEEICLLSGWNASKGARLEQRIAAALGMKQWVLRDDKLRELNLWPGTQAEM